MPPPKKAAAKPKAEPTATATPEDIQALRNDLEALRQENRDLASALEALKARETAPAASEGSGGLRPGAWVEIAQATAYGGLEWIPLLVTQVHEGDQISGVGFTGEPMRFSWHKRGCQSFAYVGPGEDHRCWRWPE